MFFEYFGLCFELNASIHKERDMPRGTWKELASCPPQDFLNWPGNTCIYSVSLEGAELKDLSCLVAFRHVRWNLTLPPPHPLSDVANMGLLLCSCKPFSVPHDTGGRLECLCGSSCVNETVGARMSFSFRALALVSQPLGEKGGPFSSAIRCSCLVRGDCWNVLLCWSKQLMCSARASEWSG